MIERQELYCTECHRYVQFDLEMDGDGDYEIACPNCQHLHYRKVINGLVSEERWRSSSNYISASNTTYSITSTYTTYATAATTDSSVFLYEAWMNSTTAT